ncbi:MAG: oxidoreductase NAD-binding domain protein, partial [Rhodocyclales bacterium]|nr:oxidoreductase NAD-binding domain protein [Rhodocyclales bacterium]
AQRVLHIASWAPNLFSLRITKPAGFLFTPGHYARLGLPVGDESPIWRAYSIVTAPHEEFLEFLVTVVVGGNMSRLLTGITEGAEIMVESAAMGFFVAAQLAPGETLWMLSTGSGVGPYVSMLREGSVCGRYRKVVIVHSVRTSAELAYTEAFRELAAQHAIEYVPVVTREAGATALAERVPLLVDSGTLAAHVGEKFDAETARVMVCGNPDFTADMRRVLSARGFVPCRRGLSGSMLFENYW